MTPRRKPRPLRCPICGRRANVWVGVDEFHYIACRGGGGKDPAGTEHSLCAWGDTRAEAERSWRKFFRRPAEKIGGKAGA